MAILTPFRHRFWDNAGNPCAGGNVYVYEAGTTTPKNSYTSAAGTTPNTNPVILDSKGEADIWTTGLFKLNLTDSTGTQVTGYPVDNLGAGQSSYDITAFVAGKPTSSQVLLAMVMIRQVTFDTNMLLSKATATVSATASTVFNLNKNGVNFGTVTFAIGATTATFVSAVPPSFAIGDVLTIVAPASVDATLATIAFTLAGAITP